jgi:hypothetical protein
VGRPPQPWAGDGQCWMSRLLEDRDESMGRLTTGRMLRLEGREERQHRCEEEEGTSHTLHLNVRLVHNNNDCVGSLDSSSGCFLPQ